jgi:MFS family permease
LKAGLLLLPTCGISSISTIITGILVSRTKKIKLFSLIGWALFTFGQIPLSAGILKAHSSIASWVLLNVCQGIGNGMLIVTCTLAVQASAESRTSLDDKERVRIKSMAAALNPFFRALGNTVGVVVGAVTVSNELRKRVGKQQSSSILTIVETLRQTGVGEQTTLSEAVVKSLNVLWLILNVIAAINLALCLFTKDFDLGKAQESSNSAEMDPQITSRSKSLDKSGSVLVKEVGSVA